MRILSIFCLFLFLVQPISSWAQPQVKNIQPEQTPPNEQRVAQLFVGTFSDGAHEGEKVAEGVEQLLQGQRIWQERKDGAWVYMKWVRVDQPERPLTEVFLHFEHVNKDTFSLQLFPVPEEVLVDESYQKPNLERPQDDCQPSDLMEINGCGYLLVRKDKEHYQVLHNKNYCPFENGYSPVPYFDLAIDVMPGQLSFNTRFFDLNQKEVLRHKDHAYKKL